MATNANLIPLPQPASGSLPPFQVSVSTPVCGGGGCAVTRQVDIYPSDPLLLLRASGPPDLINVTCAISPDFSATTSGGPIPPPPLLNTAIPKDENCSPSRGTQKTRSNLPHSKQCLLHNPGPGVALVESLPEPWGLR